MLVFTRPKCKYSSSARKFLTSNNKKFKEIKCIDVDDMVSKIKENKLRVPRIKTFPRVFDGSNLIGGFDDLKKIYNGG